MKSNNYQSIVRDQALLDSVTPAVLSLEQKYKSKAAVAALEQQDYMVRAIEEALSRVLNENDVIVDLNLCTGAGIEEWYTDPHKLRVKSEIEGGNPSEAFAVIDFDTVFQLATISFGGVNRDSDGEYEDKKELTPSERRVGLRFASAQISALQKVLFPSGASMPVEHVNAFELNNEYEQLIFKVRASLSNQMVSWYLWLPVTLFVAEPTESTDISHSPLMAQDDWQSLPVKCSIELAKCTVSIKELEQFISGSLMPIELNDTAILSLGNMILFDGKVLEDEKNLHFKVEPTSSTNK